MKPAPVAASRRSTARPDLARREAEARRLLQSGRAENLIRAVRALEEIAAIQGAARLEARDPEPDVMLVRHLGVEHLGRWIYLPGRPALGGPFMVAEPSIAAAGGRLVGIRPGKVGTRSEAAYRILVVLQGSASVELPTRVDDRVDVAPREW